jgi:hypothetical protein
MNQAASTGQIWVVDEVYAELKRKDDSVYQWVKGREAIVVPIDEQIQEYLVEIMKKYPRLVDTKRNRSGCDPWVIALAKARNLSVVTAEKVSGSLIKPKIPDACKDMGLPCIEVIEFFRQQGWRL